MPFLHWSTFFVCVSAKKAAKTVSAESTYLRWVPWQSSNQKPQVVSKMLAFLGLFWVFCFFRSVLNNLILTHITYPLPKKTVYTKTKYSKNVFFYVKDGESTNFTFSLRENPSVSRAIHTLTGGLVLGVQGGLWKAHPFCTANKFLLKVSWRLLVSKPDSSSRSDWYAAAVIWLCPTRLGLCVNQSSRNKAGCILMI